MKDNDLRLYVWDLQRQARIATSCGAAIDELEASRQAMSVDMYSESFFLLAQQVLTTAGLASKHFWADTSEAWSPERIEFALDRAKSLRDIAKPANILQRRAVRNSLEHFDERLDGVLFENPDVNIANDMISSSGDVGGNLLFLRHIDPETGVYSILDDSVSLPELIMAMGDVGVACSEWINGRP